MAGQRAVGEPTPGGSVFRSAIAAALLGSATLAAAADTGPIATIVEGKTSAIRGLARFDVAEGLRLSADDLLHTGDGAFVRVEFDDGAVVDLGPSTLVQLNHPAGRKAGCAALYLLSGWIKLASPKPEGPRKYGVCAPAVLISEVTGSVVLQSDGSAASVYVEDGKALASDRRGHAAKPYALKRGTYLALAPDHPATELEHPVQAFVQAVPRLFRDALPQRYAQLQGKAKAAQGRGGFAYADVEPWIDAEAPLRRPFVALWREKADDPAFRAGLERDLRRHPEWDPILHPPPPPPPADAARPVPASNSVSTLQEPAASPAPH